MRRPSLPKSVEIEVLSRSARRCALCYGLDNDFSEKQGQIAHLDKDSFNHSVENLAFLCLNHHDRYDGKSSQSKGYRSAEVIQYREELYSKVSSEKRGNDVFDEEVAKSEKWYELVESIEYRFGSLGPSKSVLQRQILTRCNAVFEFLRQAHDWPDSERRKALLTSLEIPLGVYGLDDGELPESWLDEVEELISSWIDGSATYEDCTDILIELDGRYELDLHWLLFGIPNDKLPRLGYEMLKHFVYVFGMRGQSGMALT